MAWSKEAIEAVATMLYPHPFSISPEKMTDAIAWNKNHALEKVSAALAAAYAIDGDYNAGVEDAAKLLEQEGHPLASWATRIRKLKKVTP